MSGTGSRCERIRNILAQQMLEGWFSWRPDEQVLRPEYAQYWGPSFLLFLRFPHGIRVNAISPGNVAVGSSLKVFEEDTAYRNVWCACRARGSNSPEAIADAFVFLFSPLAKEITGQVLCVDLGVSNPQIG